MVEVFLSFFLHSREKIQGKKFFTKWCAFEYSCIEWTGTRYREEGRYKLWLTISVAQSVVVLMIAKGFASPSTSILLEERILRNGWWLLPLLIELFGCLLSILLKNSLDFLLSLACSVIFHQIFSKETFWSVFLDYVFVFWHRIFRLLFITRYCHQSISTSIIRQRIKCLPYHGDGNVHVAARSLCHCKRFCNIFWNVALNLRNLFMDSLSLTL